jgi:hypothetical protein
MGLFKKKLRGGEQEQSVTYEMTYRISTEERINVVGESHYQPAIRAASGWKPDQDTLVECMAELVPEPTNQYDENAIMVKIDGRQVGYLSRQDAKGLGPYIANGIRQQGTGMCHAVIAGHADGETDNLGVFLHLMVSRDL